MDVVGIGSTFTLADLRATSMTLVRSWPSELLDCPISLTFGAMLLVSGNVRYQGYLQILVCSDRCIRPH